MRRLAALLLLVAAAPAALALPPTVSNVRVAQLRDGSGQVEVIYDLYDPDTMTDTISAVASLDGGATWTLRVTSVLPLPGMGVAQFGPGIRSGPNKGFHWELGLDYPGLYCPDLVLRVVASDAPTFTRLYGGAGYDVGYCLVAAPGGGYLIVGATSSFGGGGRDIWLLKTDADGNEEWQRTVGGPADEVGWHAVVNPTGGYFIAATVESWGLGESDLFLMEIDAQGQPVWGRNYGGERGDTNPHVAILPDGDILFGGSVSRSDIDSAQEIYWHSDLYLARLDSLGEPRWETLLDGPGSSSYPYEPTHQDSDMSVGIVPLASGHILAASMYGISGEYTGYLAVWLVEYTAEGSIVSTSRPLYTWSHGSEDRFWTQDFQPAPGDGYLLAGSFTPSALWSQPYVFRTGAQTWHRAYSQWECIFSAARASTDGCTLAAGGTSGSVGGKPLLGRLSATGEALWLQIYEEGWNSGTATDLLECIDGGILVTGVADGDLLLMKVDADGNPDP